MIGFILQRLAWLLPLLWVIATGAFLLMRAVPGAPFTGERKLPPAIEQNLKRKYDLDKPVFFNRERLREDGVLAAFTQTQYFTYMKNLAKGDLGPSYKYPNRTVNEIVAEAFPISLALGVLGMTFALLIGVTAGVLAASRQNSALDHAAMGFSMVGICMPSFVLGLLLLMVFSFLLRALPVAGWGGVSHMLLPALTLGAPYAAYIARLTRGSMLEVVRQDYIRTARAKGMRERNVLLRHALRNAMLPVISFLGPALAGIITGSLVVEKIFAIPGIGSHFVNAALNRDYTLVMGTVLLYSALLILFNLAVDVAYCFVDPRVKPK